MSSLVEKKLEIWKKKLLDMSMKNRLLNYYKRLKMEDLEGSRHSLSSFLDITSPDYLSLYQQIVTDEKALTFPRLVKKIKGKNAENDSYAPEREIKGDIVTDRSTKDTELVLRKLSDKSKTVVEEQGVNVLYLSFGFLEWKESTFASQAGEPARAPLILVPVSLSAESFIAPFSISLHEDEIVLNPTLCYKMETDFGLKLPEFDPAKDDVAPFLNAVEEKVRDYGWNVQREASLAMLSFLKINMYKDLERNAERICRHEIIRALARERDEEQKDTSLSSNWNEDYDRDKTIKPLETFQVVDADSSQQDAVYRSKLGQSFVLQGPPGTGKSQTITNIIAEALADGKNVLFVSEKIAALDVVYKRLEQTGLADFCLVLHSNKANKREFLDSLQKVIDRKAIEVKEDAYVDLGKLEDIREKLNEYCRELSRVIEPLKTSVFQANGEVASREAAPNVLFDFKDVDVRQTTRERLELLREQLQKFVKAKVGLKEDFREHAWRHTTITVYNNENIHRLNSALDGLQDGLDRYQSQLDACRCELQLDLNVPVSQLRRHVKLFQFCSTGESFPTQWLTEPDLEGLSKCARTLKERQEKELKLRSELLGDFTESFFELDSSGFNSEIAAFLRKIQPWVADGYVNLGAKWWISNLAKAIKTVEYGLNKYREEKTLLGLLAEKLCLREPKEQSQIGEFCVALKSWSAEMKPVPFWFTSEWKPDERNNQLEQASELARKLTDARNTLLEKYEKEILDIDYRGMLIRFKTDYASFFRFFNKEYRGDCKTVRGLCKVLTKKISYREMYQLLEQVKNYHELLDEFTGKSELFGKYLGGWFVGEETDFDRVRNAFENFDRLLSVYQNSIPGSLKDELLSGANVGKYREEIASLTKLNDDQTVKYIARFARKEKEKDGLDLILNHLEQIRALTLEIDERLEVALKTARSGVSYERCYEALQNLDAYQSLKKKDEDERPLLEKRFDRLFNGVDSEWTRILDLLDWVSDFRQYAEELALSEDFQKAIAERANSSETFEKWAETLDRFVSENSKFFNMLTSCFKEEARLRDLRILELKDFIRRLKENFDGLRDWIEFQRQRKNCESLGLTSFVDAAMGTDVRDDQLEDAFLKQFYRLWLDAVASELPAIGAFRGSTQEELIRKFRELDQLQFKIAQARIRERILGKLPDFGSFVSAHDEVGFLRHELGKQRKIAPVRKILDGIPSVLPLLKPCLMTSPLSVSLFLQSDAYKFDLVVFDEASQVRTENAIGAISRAKQVIVAGDSKQLPPTSFFEVQLSGSDSDDEEEQDDSDSYDSALDELGSFLSQMSLRWHYRSRNEGLIAFSNCKIYGNELVTFPAPYDETSDGVKFIYVENGVFQSGGGRKNPIEARKVVDVVFEEIQKRPERSIGVVTFSIAQQECVKDELRKARRARPEFDDFFNEDREEAFFVKNLENVQGDERDTIVFSVGYGKASPNEALHMRFGPLNRLGGERRLNVAITRARHSVKVVSSIKAADIRIDESTHAGVKLLRDYLDYAERGVVALSNSIEESGKTVLESPFEESVYKVLTDAGYEVATQVGCSGYRIDMAVRSPSQHGRFILAVECDGASYHSSRTARERDRLRQAVLENMGWKFYRIWSTDWIKNPADEAKRLLEAVEEAFRNDGRIEASCSAVFSSSTFSKEAEDYEEEVEKSSEAEKNGFGFETFEEVSFPRRIATEKAISNALQKLLKTQAPLHIQLAYKQLAPLYDNIKATQKVKEGVDHIVRVGARDGLWLRLGDFLWLPDLPDAIPRVPASPDFKRTFAQIAIEELAEAMIRIVATSYGGVNIDGLFSCLVREYGYARVTNSMSTRLNEALDLLAQNKRVKLDSTNRVSLVENE